MSELERYVAAWKSGDRGEIEALLSDDAHYRYHPYDERLVRRAAIADSWLDEPDEPGSFDASYECFAADGDSAVAIGTSSYFDGEGVIERVYGISSKRRRITRASSGRGSSTSASNRIPSSTASNRRPQAKWFRSQVLSRG